MDFSMSENQMQYCAQRKNINFVKLGLVLAPLLWSKFDPKLLKLGQVENCASGHASEGAEVVEYVNLTILKKKIAKALQNYGYELIVSL